jgi:hypothetical protein
MRKAIESGAHQERWREEVFDEPELDGALGVLQDAKNHDGDKPL